VLASSALLSFPTPPQSLSPLAMPLRLNAAQVQRQDSLMHSTRRPAQRSSQMLQHFAAAHTM
jgi:hypothetical protein